MRSTYGLASASRSEPVRQEAVRATTWRVTPRSGRRHGRTPSRADASVRRWSRGVRGRRHLVPRARAPVVTRRRSARYLPLTSERKLPALAHDRPSADLTASARWPFKASPTEQMQVNVKHRLARIAIGVEDRSESAGGDLPVPRQSPRPGAPFPRRWRHRQAAGRSTSRYAASARRECAPAPAD